MEVKMACSVSMDALMNALRGINDLAEYDGVDIEKTILNRIKRATTTSVEEATADFKKKLEEGYFSTSLKDSLTDWRPPLWIKPADDSIADELIEAERKARSVDRSDLEGAVEELLRFKIEAARHISIGELSAYRRGINDAIRILQRILEG